MAMDWYVLFVRTGYEHMVERLLKKCMDSSTFMPFIPLHEKIFKISGSVKKEVKPLFPGYMFIESEAGGQEFIKSVNAFRYFSCDIIRTLKYSDTEIAMRESERQMLLSLCNGNHCIEASSGIIEGDRIHVTDGPLKGWESIVRKVDRHKRQTWIEIEFMGEKRLVSVALEIVKKSEEIFEAHL